MGKSKNIGKDKYARYKTAQKREKGHVKRIRAYITLYPTDKQARDAFKAWEARLN